MFAIAELDRVGRKPNAIPQYLSQRGSADDESVAMVWKDEALCTGTLLLGEAARKLTRTRDELVQSDAPDDDFTG